MGYFSDVAKRLCSVIESMTGIEPEMDSTLNEIGLASVGIPVIVGMLNSNFSTKKNPLSITLADLVGCRTIEDIGECSTIGAFCNEFHIVRVTFF